MISLDQEIIDNLQNIENSSKLINDLLTDYFCSGRNLEEEELKNRILKLESEILERKGQINNMKDRIRKIVEKDKEIKKSFKHIPQAILDDFKLWPDMTESVLKNRYQEIYSNKFKNLEWEELLKAFNKSNEVR